MSGAVERDTKRAEAAGYLLDKMRRRSGPAYQEAADVWSRRVACTALDALGHGDGVPGVRADLASALAWFREQQQYVAGHTFLSALDQEITGYVDVIIAALEARG